MRVEKAAKKLGITKRVLRSLDTVRPPTRTIGGHRIYTEEDLEALRHILRDKCCPSPTFPGVELS